MSYKKNTPVLPNFIKALLTAIFAFSTSLAMAEHHGQAEDKIRDLKDMTPTELPSTDLDSEAVTDKASGEVEEMIDEAKDKISEEAQQQAKELIKPEG